MSVITSSTFDAKKLTVSDVKKIEKSLASQVYINYAGGKLRLQAPRLPVPYNAGDYENNKKFKVQFSFRDRGTKAVDAYMNTLQAIDDFVIDQATKNAGKWFKLPDASRATVAALYTKTIKYSKDEHGKPKDYPPTQSVTLRHRDEVFDAVLYDNARHEIEGKTPMESLRRGAEVTPVLDATGIWIAGGKFGLTWKLVQAMINVPGEGISKNCLIVEEDSESAPASGVSAAEERNLMAAVMPTEEDEDKEDEKEDEDDEKEDEDEENEEEAPPPVVVATKKKVAAPVAAAPAPAPAPAPEKKSKKVPKA